MVDRSVLNQGRELSQQLFRGLSVVLERLQAREVLGLDHNAVPNNSDKLMSEARKMWPQKCIATSLLLKVQSFSGEVGTHKTEE